MSKKIPTPKPITISQECSICGLDWSLHPDNPTILDCVERLKARPPGSQSWWYQTYPYQVTYTTNPAAQIISVDELTWETPVTSNY
jgi:hypothetical protein